MNDNSRNILSSIRPSKIILPIIIGLSISGYMMYNEFDSSGFSTVSFTLSTIFWLIISILFMAIRDFGYIIRIRLLSDNELSWGKAFYIVMLWEFTSSITPSAIGGTSVAIFFLNKEGIRIGRSTGIVMITSFLDELFFIIIFPIILVFIGRTDVFTFSSSMSEGVPWYKNQYFILALTGYAIKFIYTTILAYGIFINPRGLKFLLLWIFKLPIIRKWRPNANESGSELILTAKYFKHWSIINWGKAFVATSISWISRYWIVNTLIISLFGFQYLDWDQHILLFGKQLVMWIMMLVSPTPGGSGFAEYVFKEFLAGTVPSGPLVTLAFLWRLISYYPYLIIGVIIVPRWIRKHFVKR